MASGTLDTECRQTPQSAECDAIPDLAMSKSYLVAEHDMSMLRRVKSALTPLSIDQKLKQVCALEDRIAMEVAAYKQRIAEIEWDKKSSISTLLWKKNAGQGSVGRIKLHVETALHKRAVEVLRAQVGAVTCWKDHLRRDTIYRTLHSQGKWLRSVLNHAKTTPTSAFRRQSADEMKISSRARRMSLDECSSNSDQNALDEILAMEQTTECPNNAYVAFEVFLATSRFDKTDIGTAFEQHCCKSLLTLTSSTSFQSLVTQLANAIADEHDVSPVHPQLLSLVRKVVYSRMAGVFAASKAEKIERDQAKLSKVIGSIALLQLQEVGLPCSMRFLRASSAAFETMPYFMPDDIVKGYLKAVYILHQEVAAALSCDCTTISADIILPVIIAVITNSKLPYLHAQVDFMESIALNNGQDGGEASYYVALLQSAMAAALNL